MGWVGLIFWVKFYFQKYIFCLKWERKIRAEGKDLRFALANTCSTVLFFLGHFDLTVLKEDVTFLYVIHMKEKEHAFLFRYETGSIWAY